MPSTNITDFKTIFHNLESKKYPVEKSKKKSKKIKISKNKLSSKKQEKNKLKSKSKKSKIKTNRQKTTGQKTTGQKTKETKKVRVEGMNNYNNDNEYSVYEAGYGDKIRSYKNFTDYGRIVKRDKKTGRWITNTGKKLHPDKQDIIWEVVDFNIYVVSLRPIPKSNNKQLPYGWPFNLGLESNDKRNNEGNNGNNSSTDNNNVDLLERNNNELRSIENQNNIDYEGIDNRTLYMCVVSARNQLEARKFIINNGLNAREDMDDNLQFYDKSIWLDNKYTSCKYLGTSHFQEPLLLCINKY